MLFSVQASPRWIEEPLASTAIALTGTAQFIEARRSDYKFFKTSDLWARAATILQIQFFMLYQWSLERFVIAHPTAEALIPSKYYMVNTLNFTPEDDDIILYLQDPKFLWRFSIRNYGYFAKIFGRYLPFFSFTNDFADGKFATYRDDDSPLLPYVQSNSELVKSALKNKLKIPKSLVSRGIKLERIKQIEKKFHGRILTQFEKSECFYSDDFYLHLMGSDFDYDDFVQTLITGHTFRGPGNLLQLDIQQSNQRLRAEKAEKRLLKNEKKVSKKESKGQKNKKLEAKKQKGGPRIESRNFLKYPSSSGAYQKEESIVPIGQTVRSSLRVIRSINSTATSVAQSSSSKYSTINSSIAKERLSRRALVSLLAPANPYLSTNKEDIRGSAVQDTASGSFTNEEETFHTANVFNEQRDIVPIVEHDTQSTLDEEKKAFSNFAEKRDTIGIPTDERVEIVDCFDPPHNALPYLGKAGKVDRKLRLTHLIELARVRKESVTINNDYYTCSFWNHRALLSDFSKPQSFYKVAYQYFGEVVNVNQFVDFNEPKGMSRIGWRLPCTAKQQSNFIAKYLVAVENYKMECFAHIPIVKKDINGRWVTEKSPLYLGENLQEILNSPISGAIWSERTRLSDLSFASNADQLKISIQNEIDRNVAGKTNEQASLAAPINLNRSAFTNAEAKIKFPEINMDGYYRPPTADNDNLDLHTLAETFNPWMDSASIDTGKKTESKNAKEDLFNSVIKKLEAVTGSGFEASAQNTPKTLNKVNALEKGLLTTHSDRISFHTCDLSLSSCGTEIERMVDEKTDFLFSNVEARLSKIPIKQRNSLTVIQCVEEEMATRPRMRGFFYETKNNYLKTGKPIDSKFAVVNCNQHTTESDDSLGDDINDFIKASRKCSHVRKGLDFQSNPISNPTIISVTADSLNDVLDSNIHQKSANSKALIPLENAEEADVDANTTVSGLKREAEVKMPILKAENEKYDASGLSREPIGYIRDMATDISSIEMQNSKTNSKIKSVENTSTSSCVGALELGTDENYISRINSTDMRKIFRDNSRPIHYNRNSRYADILHQVEELEDIFKLMLQKEGAKSVEFERVEDANYEYPVSRSKPLNCQFVSDNYCDSKNMPKTHSSEGATDILDIIDDYIDGASILNDENNSIGVRRLCLTSF